MVRRLLLLLCWFFGLGYFLGDLVFLGECCYYCLCGVGFFYGWGEGFVFWGVGFLCVGDYGFWVVVVIGVVLVLIFFDK